MLFRMGGGYSSERLESPVKKTSPLTNDGIYYRDPNVSIEFNGPFDESTVQHWYREGYFHTGIQFRLGNCSGYTTLGRLRELNGFVCPFSLTKDARDEEIRYLVEQLREAKWRLNEMGDENREMKTRIEWLEISCKEVNNELERKRRDGEGMRTMIDRLNVRLNEIGEALHKRCNGMNDEMERNRRDTEGMRTMIDKLTMKPDAPKKETEVETKNPLEKAVLSTSYAQVVRAVPEQQSIQKKVIVEKDSYQRFIKDILGVRAVIETKASGDEIIELVDFLKREMEKGNKHMKKLYAVLKPHMADTKCMLPCGQSLSILTPGAFISHICSKKHVKYMNDTGVSRKSVTFFIDEFKKLA